MLLHQAIRRPGKTRKPLRNRPYLKRQTRAKATMDEHMYVSSPITQTSGGYFIEFNTCLEARHLLLFACMTVLTTKLHILDPLVLDAALRPP